MHMFRFFYIKHSLHVDMMPESNNLKEFVSVRAERARSGTQIRYAVNWIWVVTMTPFPHSNLPSIIPHISFPRFWFPSFQEWLHCCSQLLIQPTQQCHLTWFLIQPSLRTRPGIWVLDSVKPRTWTDGLDPMGSRWHLGGRMKGWGRVCLSLVASRWRGFVYYKAYYCSKIHNIIKFILHYKNTYSQVYWYTKWTLLIPVLSICTFQAPEDNLIIDNGLFLPIRVFKCDPRLKID